MGCSHPHHSWQSFEHAAAPVRVDPLPQPLFHAQMKPPTQERAPLIQILGFVCPDENLHPIDLSGHTVVGGSPASQTVSKSRECTQNNSVDQL